MVAAPRGLLDTSVFIAAESGRRILAERLPLKSATTVVTLAELRLGVLAAPDTESAARRLRTLEGLARIHVVQVDDAAASAWASLRLALRERGRRMNVNDLWIAAIAVANRLPIVTQDADFDALDGVPGVECVRV